MEHENQGTNTSREAKAPRHAAKWAPSPRMVQNPSGGSYAEMPKEAFLSSEILLSERGVKKSKRQVLYYKYVDGKP